MVGFICWLHEWQELIGGLVGAFIGGIMGFIGAWLVIFSADKKEDRKDLSAASIIATDIVFVIIWAERQADFLSKAGLKVTDPGYNAKFCKSALKNKRYEISPAFWRAVERAMGLEDTLPMHLKLFTSALQSIDKHLNGVKKDYEVGYTGPMSSDRTAQDTKLDEASVKRMSDHMLQHGLAILGILVPKYRLSYLEGYLVHKIMTSKENRKKLLESGLFKEEQL
jgi:hypothetical protein